LTILRALTQTRMDTSRLIGNDSALAQAMAEGLCDGVISGVACVLPEVIQSLFASHTGEPGFHRAAGQLNEFVAKIDALPIPWGLKAIAEARGIAPATYHQPVSSERARQIEQILCWFDGWIHQVVDA
jgi:4-hydroxy-tetrahydrodipicolinate synthase